MDQCPSPKKISKLRMTININIPSPLSAAGEERGAARSAGGVSRLHHFSNTIFHAVVGVVSNNFYLLLIA
jgi:hypothetical protein